jgi:hypothetical protein
MTNHIRPRAFQTVPIRSPAASRPLGPVRVRPKSKLLAGQTFGANKGRQLSAEERRLIEQQMREQGVL